MIKRCVLIYGRRLGRRKCLSAMQPSKRAVPRNPHMLVFSFWKNHPRKLRGQCSGQDLRPRTLHRRGLRWAEGWDSPRTAPGQPHSAPPVSGLPLLHRLPPGCPPSTARVITGFLKSPSSSCVEVLGVAPLKVFVTFPPRRP